MAENKYKIDKTPVKNTIDDKAIATKQLEESNREIPTTFSDMLAPFRETAKQDKTDAVKMQKYYALTDALRSLGNMGGAAVGGAIGGNMMDSAPAVAEYKPNRGYLDAIEKAKNANDRLRALDEKEFQLRYQKSQKDADRAYQEKQLADNRAWQAKMQEEDRNFRMKMTEYQNQLAEAKAEKNLEREKELRGYIAQLQLDHDTAIKKLGLQTSQWQYDAYNTVPLGFKDGSMIKIPKSYQEALTNLLIGETINGVTVDEYNVGQMIKNNPELIKGYLNAWGLDTTSINTPISLPTTETSPEPTEEEKKEEKKENRKKNRRSFFAVAGGPTRTGAGYKQSFERSTANEENVAEEDNWEEEFERK